MNTKRQFILIACLILAMTAAALVLAIIPSETTPAWRYAAAQICFISIVVLFIILYRKTVKPIDVLTGGIDLLKEQDFSTRLRPVGQTNVDRIIELFNRMSDQLHNEELRAKEQNYFLELLIAASPMGVMILDIDGRISSANPAMCRMLGTGSIDRFKGLAPGNCGHPLLDIASGVEKDSGKVIQTDPLHIYKCTLSTFMDRGFPRMFYMIEPLTEELFEAEKRGYRKVIRIISHEVNNTMAGLTSALGAIEQSSEESGDTDTATMLSILLSRIDRMSRFITEYASMARIPDPVCRPADSNSFLLRTLPFLESLKGTRQISFAVDLDDHAGTVSIDPVLMEQVLTNIVKNAVEAFPSDSETNLITITSRPGYWCVSDNGAPIPEEVARNLFTPFFSTKPEGKGIGLAVIHEILTRSGIRFSLATGPDGITRFEMFWDK